MVWLGTASSPQTSPLLWSLGVATPYTLDLMCCPNLDSFNAVPLSFPTLTTDPQTSCFHRKYDDRIHILPHPENSSESRHQKVYSCGQAQHLPSIWKLHFLCLGWVMGLRSCLRGEGSCSNLGLLGAALLGGGAAATGRSQHLHWGRGACGTCLPNSRSYPQPQEQRQHWLNSVVALYLPWKDLTLNQPQRMYEPC